MTERYLELESKISRLLPMRGASIANLEIINLTKMLIAESKNAWRTIGYTHAVCHLFEKYGRKDEKSYLHATQLFPIAEQLVDVTLKKATQEQDFGCVSRIVRPIADLNLANLEQNQKGFTFKPTILTATEFLKGYSTSSDVEYRPWLVDFCKAQNIGDFFPIYAQALRAKKKLGTVVEEDLACGVFIDVDDTLISGKWDSKTGKVGYIVKPLIQEYALRKISEGRNVTIFTGGDPKVASETLDKTGLDKKLVMVKPKAEFIGRTLEICVDDTIPAIQGFRAKTHYESGVQAYNAEYSH